jgi:hypothetical protein
MVSKAWKFFCVVTDSIERRGANFVVGLVGLYFTSAHLISLTKDTTTITNAAFAIMASLAALCFSYARCLDQTLDVRPNVIHSGERFFHAAIILLTASLIKYIALACVLVEIRSTIASTILWILGNILGFIVMALFIRALFFANTAIVEITNILWNRPRKGLLEVDR